MAPRTAVVLDPDVRRLEEGRVLLGGVPGRLVRLRPAAVEGLARLARGEDVPAAVRALAGTLVAGGLAHPRPQPAAVDDVTVLVPVRDRADELARCLAAVGRDLPVLVVDDGSADPAAVAAVCERAGARVLHLPHNVGPAAARDAGLAQVTTGAVALLDSDCTPEPGWLGVLLAHLADPQVAAVAPRVVVAPGGAGLLARYVRARGPLDMGEREGPVQPGTRLPYVPTAALVVRRSALPDPAFDPALRYGEDVDLVWRLHDAGHRVRYDPRAVVAHAEPGRWRAWLVRRWRYGTSAAPLAARHGARLTPLVVLPWQSAAWLLPLLGRPALGAVAHVAPAAALHRRLRRAGLPRGAAARTALAATSWGVHAAVTGVGGAGLVATAPLLAAGLAARRTRAAALTGLLAPPLVAWVQGRPGLDPARWTALRLLDDLAYAGGVWAGCLRGRTVAPLLPRLRRPA